MTRNMTSLVFACLTTVLFAVPTGIAGHGPPPPCGEGQPGPIGEPGGPSEICTISVRDGASCNAYGIVVLERDFAGNDLLVGAANSRAVTQRGPAPMPTNAFTPLVAPDPASDHADAAQLDFTYQGLLASVSAKTVHSRCDVVSSFNEYTEAYGKAGVEELTIQLPSMAPITFDVLSFTLDVYDGWKATEAWQTCSIIQEGNFPLCPGSATGTPPGSPVSVVVDHNWGPMWTPSGAWAYGGAALHIEVNVGAAILDIYVGYVTVGLTMWGGPAPLQFGYL